MCQTETKILVVKHNGLLFSFSYKIMINITSVDTYLQSYVNGLAQDCSYSSALALELLQSCTNPSICRLKYVNDINDLVQHCSNSSVLATAKPLI